MNGNKPAASRPRRMAPEPAGALPRQNVDRDGCILVALKPDEMAALRAYWDAKAFDGLTGRAHSLTRGAA